MLSFLNDLLALASQSLSEDDITGPLMTPREFDAFADAQGVVMGEAEGVLIEV